MALANAICPFVPQMEQNTPVCVAGSGLHTGDRVLAMNGTVGASALKELMV